MGLWLVLWVLPPSKKWVGMFALSRSLCYLTCATRHRLWLSFPSVAMPPKKRQKKEAKSDKSSSKKEYVKPTRACDRLKSRSWEHQLADRKRAQYRC
eukprot:g73324.t1